MDLIDQNQGLAVWLGAVATVVLMIVAGIQLRAIRSTSRADFIHRLNQLFFTDRTNTLLRALSDRNPTFDENDGSPQFVEGRLIVFTADELDDHLLGPLEDVGIFEHLGAVELNAVYDEFAFFIYQVWKNPEIKKYILWSRKQPDGWDLYERLEEIYLKCEAYEKEKKQLRDLWICEVDFGQQ